MALSDILKEIAPTIATALGGPLAGAAVSFLSSKLGVDPSIVEQTVAGMKPPDLLQMKQLDNDFKLEMAKQGIALQLAQIATNTEEAKSINWFVAGWRPFVGWVGGFALAYAAILEPLMRFCAVQFGYHGAFPILDTSITLQVLMGMLGLGGMRSFEKYKDVEGNR